MHATSSRFTRLYWLHCLSPTHTGVGRGLGYIDLPIDRDPVTGKPLIRGSALKGVWADYFRATEEGRKTDPMLRAAFGTAGANNEANAGSLIPADAHLVCLPVRSFRGTFAWATSPLTLQTLRRVLHLSGVAGLPEAPHDLADDEAHHAEGDGVKTALTEDGRIYLEDMDFSAAPCPIASQWASRIAGWVFPDDPQWQEQFQRRFVVVPDVVFDYLCETGTEIHTRVRIKDETKTVEGGALWSEESLPAESILMGVIQCDRVFLPNGEADERIRPEDLLSRFASEPLLLQIGGKATVGRGQVRCVYSEVTT
ncbi:type III-B CRISPR module RAMP protein Cmr4 [Thermopirellula anaerolimosa]